MRDSRGCFVAGRSLAERFWEKVDVRGPDDCWLWTAAMSGDYGTIGSGSKGITARTSGWIRAAPPICWADVIVPVWWT